MLSTQRHGLKGFASRSVAGLVFTCIASGICDRELAAQEATHLYVSPKINVTFSSPNENSRTPLEDFVVVRRVRGNPVVDPPVEKMPKTVRARLDAQGVSPRISMLVKGDTFEVVATDAQQTADHNIYVEWFNNFYRGFTPRLDPPLLFQRSIDRSEPGLMKIKCNIHDDIVGYLLVTEQGFAAVTDDDGNGVLNKWPAGKQSVNLFHPDYSFVNADAFVNGDKVLLDRSRLTIEISAMPLQLHFVGLRKKESSWPNR